jgi:hypothetical protein
MRVADGRHPGLILSLSKDEAAARAALKSL